MKDGARSSEPKPIRGSARRPRDLLEQRVEHPQLTATGEDRLDGSWLPRVPSSERMEQRLRLDLVVAEQRVDHKLPARGRDDDHGPVHAGPFDLVRRGPRTPRYCDMQGFYDAERRMPTIVQTSGPEAWNERGGVGVGGLRDFGQ